MPELKASPRNRALGLLADALSGAKSAADTVQLPVVGGLGSLLFGDAPELVNDVAYYGPQALVRGGNAATGGLGTFAPDRRVLDAIGVAPMAPGAVRAAKTVANPMTYGRAFVEAQAPAVMSKIFIGEKAKTWDKAAAEAFKKLEAQGVGNKEAWQQTGTFRSPDGKLRQEIDDSMSELLSAEMLAKQAESLQERNAFLKQAIKPTKQKDLFPKELSAAKKAAKDEIYSNEYNLTNYNGLLADPKNVGQLASLVFKNEPLYASYPLISGSIVRQGRDLGDKYKGQQSGAFIDVFKGALDKGEGKSTAVHEFQHAVQDIEKFAFGGTPQDELQRIIQSKGDELVNSGVPKKEAVNLINSQMEKLNAQAFDNYRRLAGEAEARASQARMNMTPTERRALFPLESYDVPINELIIRGLLD